MRPIAFPLALLTLSVLAGCSSSTPTSHQAAQPTPPLFVEQVAVILDQGQPKELIAYRKDLKRCQTDGSPTQPLSADEEGKIGRRLIQTWQQPQRFAQRTQEWHQRLNGLCQFGLIKQDRIQIYGADGAGVLIDASTGQGQRLPKLVWTVPRVVLPEDYALSTSALNAGWLQPAHQPPLLGHTCLLWQDPMGNQACVWDEGQAHGYSPSAQGVIGGDGTPRVQGSLVLWAKPAKDNGWEVRVTRLIVGQAIPASVFEIPANTQMIR